MVLQDPEALLRAMVAPLGMARRGEPLPGVPFSREAVANAFAMLGLLPEARAEEILAEYRAELEAKGFRFGVLTGELSVRAGGYGGQDALAREIRSGLAVTDDLGRRYRLCPLNWGDSPGEPGRRRWRGEGLAEPQPAGPATGDTMRWLEFAGAGRRPVRPALSAPAPAETGPADPPWPTPAEAYLAELASVPSTSIATGDASVQLDNAKIVAAVADALLWTGALPPDSAVPFE